MARVVAIVEIDSALRVLMELEIPKGVSQTLEPRVSSIFDYPNDIH